MKNLKIGFIGLGQRGNGLIDSTLAQIHDVDIVAVSDLYDDRMDTQVKKIKEKSNVDATKYKDYHDLLKSGIDVVIVSCSWENHVSVAIDCMEAGICTGMEVGGAYAVKECWDLVKTYERTKTPFMFLENCCYDKTELMATSMARKGLFGEIIHCSGAYSHDLREEVSCGNKIRHYRLRNYLNRNCENYPTHELGPIARILDVNRGNRMLSLVSVASKARGLEEYIKTAPEEKTDKTLIGKKFMQGDIVNTIITCTDGSTILLTLDTTLPTYYDRALVIKGTKGMYNQSCNYALFDSDNVHEGEEFWTGIENNLKHINEGTKYEEEHLPDYWKNITPEEKETGHGGMDVLMLRQFFDAYRKGAEMPIDVYDGASWMVISALSEQSIARGGASIDIPDFTCGQWLKRQPKDVMEY